MTLILSEAWAIVGASVTPSMGSTSMARIGSLPRSSCSPPTPSPSIRACGAVVTSNDGWRSAIALSSGASLSSALSPILGIEAWPATPSVRRMKRKTPFSATQTP